MNDILHDQAVVETELSELRYRMEQCVERRTAELLKRIVVLESCNTALCKKLDLAQDKISALSRRASVPASTSEVKLLDRTQKLHVINKIEAYAKEIDNQEQNGVKHLPKSMS